MDHGKHRLPLLEPCDKPMMDAMFTRLMRMTEKYTKPDESLVHIDDRKPQ
jgi:hypothetical protein